MEKQSNPKPKRYDPWIDSEFHILGAMIVDPRTIDHAASRLSASDFATPAYAELFVTLCNLRLSGTQWNETEMVRSIRGVAENKISNSELASMIEIGFLAAKDFEYHAKQIIRQAKRAALSEVIDEARDRLAHPENSITKTIEIIETELESLKRTKSISLFNCEQLGQLSMADKLTTGHVAAFTGLSSVDDIIGGFHSSDVAVLAARTSTGKTAFALQIAEYNANKGRPVLFVSLEMSELSIFDRLLSRDTGISVSSLRSKQLSQDEMSQLENSILQFNDLPLTVFAPSSATVTDIRMAARICNARSELALIIVDYLGFVRNDNFKLQRYEQIGQICKGLKALAKELKLPIIALSQLNRDAEKGLPTLKMLRDSGSVEEDSDQVIFIHRESKTATTGKFIIAKNRHGPCGIVEVNWEPQAMRYFQDNTWKP